MADPLTIALMAAATAAGGAGVEALTRTDPSVGRVSDKDPFQNKILRPLLFASTLGVDPSSLFFDPETGKPQQPRKGLEQLLKSGAFDDIKLPEFNPFEGQRVADLTPSMLQGLQTNQGLLGSITGSAGQVPTEAFNTLFARRGLPQIAGTEVVGEQGPEVITANQNVDVLPVGAAQPNVNPLTVNTTQNTAGGVLGRTALGNAPTAGPLATEQNQVGINPDELLRNTRLPGLAQGGQLQTGQQAVVGEQGPEVLRKPTAPVNPLTSQIQGATSRALSGAPSSEINTGTTEQLIQKSIADPLRRNFQEQTLQNINTAFAGPGFFGSARAKATIKAGQDVEQQIGSLGSQFRFQDEQARRDLAESAAGRSAASIPTALGVTNNPLVQQQLGANIGATQAGTAATQFGVERGQALLGGEVGQQQANIAGTQAGTAQTEFGTERGQQLLGGELGQQQANIGQTLSNIGMTDAQIQRTQGLIEQDIANTGQISANTEATLRQMGLTDANIEQVKANTALTDAELLTRPLDFQQQQQNIIGQQLANLGGAMQIAGIEQAHNQDVLNAEFAEWLAKEENAPAKRQFDTLMQLFGESTTTTTITPGIEGVGGSLIAAGGSVLGGALAGQGQ